MLNIGALNRRITIERRAVSRAWEPLCTVWAELLQQSANEYLTGFGEAEAGSVVFRVRYRPGITTADRVTYAGTAYNLKEINEVGRRDGLELRGVAIR